MHNRFASILIVFLLAGCWQQEEQTQENDLNHIRNNFIASITESHAEESPFYMDYKLRTVFFSQDIISLFGEIHVYDHLPHPWSRYEGKTLCRIQGKLKEVELCDLFITDDQKELMRQYCENSLKSDPTSYFSGENPLRSRLEYDDIHNFVIDDKFLIIFFQPYRVAGLGDGPPHVKIPHEHLTDRWNVSHPLLQLLYQALSSGSYMTSWDEEHESLEAYAR
jgi:hypothetical protein